MSWRRLCSRVADPTAPRKYLLVTMLVALTDQKSGNSTPRCSKLTVPSRQFVITTSRCSQVTWSYGCCPSVVKTRFTLSPPAVLLFLPAAAPVPVPTVSVIGRTLTPAAGRLNRRLRADRSPGGQQHPPWPHEGRRSPSRSLRPTRRTGRHWRTGGRRPRRA